MKSPARWRAHGAWSALCLIFGAVVVVLGAGGVQAQSVISREYQVKAAFLYNFARFVEWPTNAFSAPDAPLVIGILGDDPYGSFLDQLVEGEQVGGRPLLVRRYRRVDEVADCHILFISGSESARLDGILTRLKDRSVLTVGEAVAFARRGGMVEFIRAEGRIRLRINVQTAGVANVTISSKLLRSAEVVKAEGGA